MGALPIFEDKMMEKNMYPDDGGLNPQVRELEDTTGMMDMVESMYREMMKLDHTWVMKFIHNLPEPEFKKVLDTVGKKNIKIVFGTWRNSRTKQRKDGTTYQEPCDPYFRATVFINAEAQKRAKEYIDGL